MMSKEQKFDDFVQSALAVTVSGTAEARVNGFSREQYRSSFLKFWVAALISKGLSPSPEEADVEKLRTVAGALQNWEGAPRSRHLYFM